MESHPSVRISAADFCSLYFASHAGLTAQLKVAEFICTPMVKALKWTIVAWESGDETLAFFGHFLELLVCV